MNKKSVTIIGILIITTFLTGCQSDINADEGVTEKSLWNQREVKEKRIQNGAEQHPAKSVKTIEENGGRVDWSPKGDYWIMDADGSNKRQLTHFNTPGYPEYTASGKSPADYSWSPDGKKIVAKVRELPGRFDAKKRIMVIERDAIMSARADSANLSTFPSLSLDFFDAANVHPGATGFQLAFYEKNLKRVIFLPWGGPDEPSGVLLAYHTEKDFQDKASYEAVDLTKLVGPAAQGFGAGFTDNNQEWLYFCPFRKKEAGKIVSNTLALRFNLRKELNDPAAYETFDLTVLKLSNIGWVHGGYADGCAYFAPTMAAGEKRMHGLFLRYHATRPFNDPNAWECFDLVENIHPQARGFQSVEVKSPYVYLIPFGAGFSHLVRYDINKPFNSASSYEVTDMKSLNRDAVGYTLSIVAGDKIIFTPWRDRSRFWPWKQSMHVAAAFDTRKPLNEASAWSFIDLTRIHPNAAGYQGGWTDENGFVYFVPTGNFAAREVPPFVIWDSSKPFNQPDSWKAYPSQGVTPSTGAAYDSAGTAWLAPYGSARKLSGRITRIKINPVVK